LIPNTSAILRRRSFGYETQNSLSQTRFGKLRPQHQAVSFTSGQLTLNNFTDKYTTFLKIISQNLMLFVMFGLLEYTKNNLRSLQGRYDLTEVI